MTGIHAATELARLYGVPEESAPDAKPKAARAIPKKLPLLPAPTMPPTHTKDAP